MSAFGYKRTFRAYLANVCFTPESGHIELPNFSAIRANIQAVLKSIREYFGTGVVTNASLWSLLLKIS